MVGRLSRPATVLTFVLAGLLASGPAAAERVVVTHQGFRAVVADTFACGSAVSVDIRAADRRMFQRDRRALQRLVGGLRATLGFECSKIQRIRLDGHAAGRLVWRGITAAANDWVLVETPVSEGDTSPAEARPSARETDRPRLPPGSLTLLPDLELRRAAQPVVPALP